MLKGYNFNSHINKCYEFIYIVKGQLLYTVEDNDSISEGNLIITKPEERHFFRFQL